MKKQVRYNTCFLKRGLRAPEMGCVLPYCNTNLNRALSTRFLFLSYLCNMLAPIFLPEATVYLKTDPEFLPRLVTSYKVTAKDITYELCCGTCVSWHYDFEIIEKLPEKENKPGFSK